MHELVDYIMKVANKCITQIIHTVRQNGFIYKVEAQAKDYQNLKVDTISIQNSGKLKSYTVEFLSCKFLSAPTGIRTHDHQI